MAPATATNALIPRLTRTLQLLADGHDYFTAADEMGLHRNTIAKYAYEVRMALGADTNGQAVAMGFRRRFIS